MKRVYDADDADYIAIIDADGSNERLLARMPHDCTAGNSSGCLLFGPPTWSPDGSQFMFAVGGSSSGSGIDTAQLYQMNGDGSNLINVSNNAYYDIEPDWWGVGPVSADKSAITVTPDRAAADGQATITLNVTVRDGYNRVIPNAAVSVSSSNTTLVFDVTSGNTDANGVFTVQVRSATITNGVISVQANGEVIGSAIVRFIGGDPAISVFGLPKILAGQDLVSAVRVSNDGLLPVQNITVRAGLPVGASTFESERHPADVQLLSQSGNQLTWLVPGLAVGETRLLYVVGRSARNLTLGTRLTFGAQVSASPDASLSNDEALFVTEMGVSQAPTATSQPEKLSVAYSASPTTANIGETVTLQVAVTNATSAETLYNVQAFARWKGLIPDLVLAGCTPSGTLTARRNSDRHVLLHYPARFSRFDGDSGIYLGQRSGLRSLRHGAGGGARGIKRPDRQRPRRHGQHCPGQNDSPGGGRGAFHDHRSQRRTA